MCVIVAHAPGSDVSDLRQIVLGAGLDCEVGDCVPWQDLAVRLAQGDADLVVVWTSGDHEFNWEHLHDATALTVAPVLAVGRTDDERIAEGARSAGVIAYLEERNLRHELDTALQRLIKAGVFKKDRGNVISVFAPSPGGGCSTVAVNLAGAFAKKHPNEVALIEATRHIGEVGLLLGATPDHTIDDVCRRWEGLDRLSLENSFFAHPSGIRLLVSDDNVATNTAMHAQSIRRIGVLTRILNKYSIFALDSLLGEAEIEAMRLSDSVLLVIRPDVPGLRVAQRALQDAVNGGVPKDRFHMAVNRWGQRGQLQRKQIATSLGLDIEHLIPDDSARINRAANKGVLVREVASLSRISRTFTALADSLNGGRR